METGKIEIPDGVLLSPPKQNRVNIPKQIRDLEDFLSSFEGWTVQENILFYGEKSLRQYMEKLDNLQLNISNMRDVCLMDSFTSRYRKEIDYLRNELGHNISEPKYDKLN